MNETATEKKRPDWSSIVIRVFSLFFLSFVAGAAVYAFKTFPYPYLRNAFESARIVYEQYVEPNAMPYFVWSKAGRDDKGVTLYEADAAYPGKTLVISTDAAEAHLVDMTGQSVHRWSARFSEVWPTAPHIDAPVADDRVFWRAAHLYPNGDLLVIFIADGVTPWGYGLAKLDKDSNVIWAYDGKVHHDVAVGEDGRIYTLIHEIAGEANPLAPRVLPPFIDDYLVVLSPEGRELERVSILEALAKSDYPGAMAVVAGLSDGKGDILHTNSVEVVPRTFDYGNLRFEPGQVIISMRSLSAIALLDLAAKRILWLQRGDWRVQHDPDLLPNGNILLFDNRGNLGLGGPSRIIEFNPGSGERVWEYRGDEAAPFYSSWRGRQQKLPNGNVLITESSTGRLFEVTPEKEIVWEYINPVRGGDSNAFIPWVVGGLRFADEDLPFLKTVD